MRDLHIDTASFSIIDLIESPVQEVSGLLGSLTREQKELCLYENFVKGEILFQLAAVKP